MSDNRVSICLMTISTIHGTDLFWIIAGMPFEVDMPSIRHAKRFVILVVVISWKCRVARVVQLHPAPVREPDGGRDLIRHPAGTLVVSEEPDVISTATPVPIRVVLLDPALGLEDHVGGMRDSQA